MMKREITLKNKWSELDRLNKWLDNLAKGIGLSDHENYVLHLALEEIVTNIMKYAYGPGVDKDIEVQSQVSDHAMEVTVIDQGTPFNPLEAKKPVFSSNIEEMKVGGLGIHIVKAMIKDLWYERRQGCNVMTVCITRNQNPDRVEKERES
jgi:serine/threonine-protein kinase RsbW